MVLGAVSVNVGVSGLKGIVHALMHVLEVGAVSQPGSPSKARVLIQTFLLAQSYECDVVPGSELPH